MDILNVLITIKEILFMKMILDLLLNFSILFVLNQIKNK